MSSPLQRTEIALLSPAAKLAGHLFELLDADGSGALDAGDIDYLQQACDMMGDGSKPPSKLGSPRAASNAGKAEASDGRDGPDRYKP